MFGVNDIEVTLYYVGKDKDEAQVGMPFDSYESANSYRLDECPDGYVFSASGMIDFTTMEKED